MKRLARGLEVLAWTAFFAFAAAALGLRYWLLPDIERYRPRIVERVTAAVGRPVKIGGIEAGWHGLRPQISLSDVRIYDAEGREALVLPSVENIFSWRALVRGELRLHALRILGPRLTVLRDAAGSLYVAGMKLSGDAREGGLADRLLDQEAIEVRNAEIEWRDEKRGAPPLVLSSLDLRLTGAGARHAVGLVAQAPPELGTRIELRAELDGRTLGEPAGWNGRLYAELGYTQLARWRAWLDSPIDLESGQGAMRLWAKVEDGVVREATADVALADVAARLGAELAPLRLAVLGGRLELRRMAAGYELSARQLQLALQAGSAQPPLDFRLAWKEAPAREGTLSASQLELAPLGQLAEALPLPADWRKAVVELEPRGRLADLRLEWRGDIAAPIDYRVRARFAELALRPREAAPGFARLAGTLDATRDEGRASLQAPHAEIELPRVFPQPRLTFDALTAQIEWQREDGKLVFRSPSISFSNADLSGNAFGSYVYSGTGPGTMDVSAAFNRADARNLAHYLPLGSLMGQGAREWLVQGVLAGHASEVHLRLKGDLADFPFADPARGQFLVRAHVQKALVNYATGWPRIHDIDGELVFERDRVDIAARAGSILGARLHDVKVAIAGVGGARAPLVRVSGRADGPTAEFLKFIESSPLRATAGRFTEGMSASGAGELRLKLELPLADLADSKVAGAYEFIDNQLRVHPALPPLEAATGRLAFTQASFSVPEVQARLFGGPVAISAVPRAGGVTEFSARGDAQIAALGALAEHPLRRYLSGGASYVATVAVREGLQRVTIESQLRGVASELPAPLDKLAADALPLRIDYLPLEGGAAERIVVSLGRLAAADVQRRREGQAMQVSRAGLAFTPVAGQAVRVPERSGVLVYGSLPALDLDRWRALLAPAGASAAPGPGLFPLNLDMKVGRLEALGKRFRSVALKAAVEAGGWNATLDAEELAGQLAYRAEGAGLLTARLAHFSLPPDARPAHGASTTKPGELPGIDVLAERFTLRGKPLGRLELTGTASGEDWRIDKLVIANPDATLRSSGMWRGGAGAPRAELELSLECKDAGKLLERVGYPGMVAGGRARLEGRIGWQGELAALDYPTLSGSLKLSAEEGEFLEIEPGLGKLVSLMNLQALPRRIALDFRDVFSKGFRFDRIDASSHLERGVMRIDEFGMKGPAAEVAMSGETDLARETQRLKVRVVPSLGGSASTVVGIVNPVVGVAAALAQHMLKNPLGRIFSHEFEVTGSWSDPKVAKLSSAVLPTEATPP